MHARNDATVSPLDEARHSTSRKVIAMNHKLKITTAMLLSIFAVFDLSAAPGTPIGGIIVKGGKNPGGQMLVSATTDPAGKFTLHFNAGGEYRLTFDQPQARNRSGETIETALQVDYLVQTPADAARRAFFHENIERGAITVTIPAGGGTITGTLSSAERLQPPKPNPKGITQSGIK
jgi:hypothetical protein